MVPWYWYLQIYQQFLWVSTWGLGFYWTKEEGRNHIFLSDFGLLWTILDCWVVPRGRLELPRQLALPPQDSVSTNSTIWAQVSFYKKEGALASSFLQIFRIHAFTLTAHGEGEARKKEPAEGAVL